VPRKPDPVLFLLGPEADERRLERWVDGAEPAGPTRTAERVLLDTFDGRLRRRGVALWREGGRGAQALRMEQPGEDPLSAPLTLADPDRILAGNLPDGVLGERLRELIGERALIPRARVRTRSRPLRVCNSDGKTVVRMSVDEPTVVRRGGARVELGPRLEVTAVLGYDREMHKVVASLGRHLQPAQQSLPDEAIRASGLPPEGVSSEVAVKLRPGMRADRAAAAICRRLAEVVDLNLPGVLADVDPEFLHDLRVAVRRSRSVLKEMRRILPADQAERSRADLRWIQEVTGPTRDLDVLLHEWPSMVRPVPAAMSGDLQPLVDLLRRQRDDSFAVMRRHLRGRRFATAWDSWRSTIARSRFDGPDAGRPIGELAAGRVVSVYRSMSRMGSGIDDSSPAAELHDLRKRGKELRYLLELFGGMWPGEQVRPLVGALKGLQDVLGHYQDDEIQVRELRALGPAVAATPGGTDSLIALGFVIEELTVRQRQARLDFGRRFADFSSAATSRIVERTFR
jgi:CHAD domain-containing protein